MSDLYLYDDVPVLKNKLGIKNEKALNLVESEQARANMMLLYEKGFDDFTPTGLLTIHRCLFSDIYDWAGQPRLINIEKREKLLAGRSVWYSNCEDILQDLTKVFADMSEIDWKNQTKEEFSHKLAYYYSEIWQIHPFREGNTRTVVMMLTFFVEHNGFYMDQELMAAGAGYVRDSFVMASLGTYSEYEHLEEILSDAICTEPVIYDEATLETSPMQESERYRKYRKEPYVPQSHQSRDN